MTVQEFLESFKNSEVREDIKVQVIELLSGDNVTDEQLEQAKELIQQDTVAAFDGAGLVLTADEKVELEKEEKVLNEDLAAIEEALDGNIAVAHEALEALDEEAKKLGDALDESEADKIKEEVLGK